MPTKVYLKQKAHERLWVRKVCKTLINSAPIRESRLVKVLPGTAAAATLRPPVVRIFRPIVRADKNVDFVRSNLYFRVARALVAYTRPRVCFNAPPPSQRSFGRTTKLKRCPRDRVHVWVFSRRIRVSRSNGLVAVAKRVFLRSTVLQML